MTDPEAFRRLSHELHNRISVVAGVARLLGEPPDPAGNLSLRQDLLSRLLANARAAEELLAAWALAAAGSSVPVSELPSPAETPAYLALGNAVTTVLVVEDDDDHFAMVLALLRRSGGEAWRILRAGSLAEARRLAVEDRPHCSLVDLSLPDAAGLDAVTQLRAVAPHLPIVVVTGVDDQSVGIEAVRRGAQDYLVKGSLLGDSLVRSIIYSIERCRFDDQLAYQALHDSLTGLANRGLLLDRMKLGLARLERHGGLAAVMFLDLDRFKLVNDSLGHHIGDELLVAVAERLRASVRRSDTVARLGGDEFIVLCEDLVDEAEAARIAEHLLELFAAPFQHTGGAQFLSASIGVALAVAPTDTAETVLSDADTAMYRAKERGKARWELFNDTLRAAVVERFETEHALRRAALTGQLRLHYQPIVELASGRIAGAEALLRWQHPRRGLLTPQQFLAVAEDTGQILEIGDWVLHRACRQARYWLEQGLVDEQWTLWVNISPVQLEQVAVTEAVTSALHEHGLPPASLGLEITETALIRDPTAAVTDLHSLKDLGVRLAIDDFGTGFSSLAWLRQFPVDHLKIDGSFVKGVGRDEQDTAIVQACVGLASALGQVAVAEAVETETQLSVLRGMGCGLGQGFGIAPPTPADEAGRFLALIRIPG